MALTITEEERLLEIFETADEVDLTEWETGFIGDLKDRYKELGSRMFVSPRMWTILSQIEERRADDPS